MKPLELRSSYFEMAQIIADALQREGNAEGKQAARGELLRMALAADVTRDLAQALKLLIRLKQIKRRIEAKTATPAERAEYRRTKEAAWEAAEIVAARLA